MSLSILHFSDIHISDDENRIVNRIEQLKMACASAIPFGNTVVFLVSGDIAFSGKESQYKIAKRLFSDISDYLVEQKQVTMHYTFVPGNHDCDFTLSNLARETLIKSALPKNIDDNYFRLVSNVQGAYQAFCEEYKVPSGKMITTEKVSVDGNQILLVLANSAWMSVLHETPGNLLFAEQFFPIIDPRNYKMVITALHHPLGWFNPDYTESICKFIRKTTDVLVFGHEHRKDFFCSQGNNWSLTEIHGKELQNSDGEDSAFSIYNFDVGFQNYECIDFEWDPSMDWDQAKGGYSRKHEEIYQYHKNSVICKSVFQPNAETLAYLNDVGIALTHYSKEDITLPEIFVWPELVRQDFCSENVSIEKIKQNILETILETKACTITGGGLLGKTALSKMIALSCISNVQEKLCCLLLNGKKIKSYNSKNLKKLVETTFSHQYTPDNLEEFRQLPLEQKVVIIDDFDCIPFRSERREKLIEYFYQNFGRVLLLLSEDLELPSIVSCPCFNHKGISSFAILPLGNKKRKELISKWYYMREDIGYDEKIEQKIEKSINQVNVFLGNGSNFIPAVPVFIIGVLQNSDALTPVNGSHYGYLYESLILKSLSVIAEDYRQSGTYDIDISILSQLAFKMLCKKKTTFSIEDLKKIINNFNLKQKLNVNADSLIQRMLISRIFTLYNQSKNDYKFKYPYIFYYFSGRYIAYHYQEDAVQKNIENMSCRLYNEDYGNIMIFVCHFANNENIITSVMVNAYDTLSNFCPFDFHATHPILDDIKTTVNELLPEYVGSNEEVPKNREKSLDAMDDIGIVDGHVDDMDDVIHDEIDEREKDLAAITASLKTLDVLGQILQNYPGGIDGNLKIEIIGEIHNLGMRSLQAFFEATGFLEENLINYIADDVAKKDQFINREKLALDTRRFLTMLLSTMVRGMIHKIAASISSKYLLPVALEVFSANESISSQLVLQELKVNCLKEFSAQEIIGLYDDLVKEKEKFACYILKSTVANYLRFNVCDYRLRAKLCEKFGLSDRKVFLESKKNELD